MKNIISLLLLLVLISACKTGPEVQVEDQAIVNTEDGKVLLRLRPTVGKTYKTRVTGELLSELQENPLDIKFNMDMNLNVEDQIDSIFNYVTSIDHLDMKVNVEGFGMNYDSDKKNTGIAAAIAEQIDPLLEETFLITMSDMGRVKDIQSDMIKEFGMDLSGMSLPLPVNSVGVGDTWKALKSEDSDNGLEMLMTVKKITNDEVYISVEGLVEEMESSTITGSYILDRETGFTKAGEMNFEDKESGKLNKGSINFKML